MQDIRWRQRFDNYLRAFQSLVEAVELSQTRSLSKLERQGLIQAFEFTHELAWNLLKDYLSYQGFIDIVGSRDATRLAFKNLLIMDGESWMDMIKARNLSSHTYNPDVAASIEKDILTRFHPAFCALKEKFTLLEQDNEK